MAQGVEVREDRGRRTGTRSLLAVVVLAILVVMVNQTSTNVVLPDIDVIWTDIPDPHAPMGAHGVGEIGIVGVGAAVANSIYNATGKRVRDMPITLDKLI